jgi:hypothetical protein
VAAESIKRIVPVVGGLVKIGVQSIKFVDKFVEA